MKSRSNSSNKAEVQMFEQNCNRDYIYSSLEMSCELFYTLCLQRLCYKSTEKLFKKRSSKTQICF